MAANRASLLQSIATTIADYRAGEVAAPDAAHVDRWISQFDKAVQLDMLVELDHVLKETYIPKVNVMKFLKGLSKTKALVGDDACAFWAKVRFLDVQRAGASQTEMLELFSEVLEAACGISIDDCGSDDGPFVYLDDAIFTGNRVRNDLTEWIKSAPSPSTLHVVVIASHSGGQYYAKTKLAEACKAVSKTITIHWWHAVEVEDRKTYIADSDVLRPKAIPAVAAAQDYVNELKYKPELRTGTSVGKLKVFSSDAGRNLLEQELLLAGLKIREQSPLLGPYQRPLGNMVLETLGFGSTIVTFRNCPNNCPLAFWAGNPWYPLFRRKTN